MTHVHWWDRFLAKTVRLPPDDDQEVGCLWWCGARSRGGQRSSLRAFYGTFNISAGLKGLRAHIVAATRAGLIEGYKVPAGMNVDHTCNRSLCVEETHLEVVTKLENQRRKARGERPLSEAQVDVIRMRGVATCDVT